MTLKLLHLWCQSQKIRTPQRNNFFWSALYYTGWSVSVLEQLSSAIGGGARALVREPKTAVFSAEIEVWIYRRLALKVLRWPGMAKEKVGIPNSATTHNRIKCDETNSDVVACNCSYYRTSAKHICLPPRLQAKDHWFETLSWSHHTSNHVINAFFFFLKKCTS